MSSRETATAWRMAPQHLERINVVQWKGRRFQIPQHPQRFSFARVKVQIYQALVKRAQKKNRDGTFAPARDLVGLQLEAEPETELHLPGVIALATHDPKRRPRPNCWVDAEARLCVSHRWI